jgi:hypothetical protein
MRLAVYGVGRLRVRRLAQAIDFALVLIDPVFVILDAVFFLHTHVLMMRLRHGFGRHAWHFVDIHVSGHGELLA